MNRMIALFCLTACLLVSAGCGGDYVLTAPDMIAPAGGEGVAVIRLQRTEVFLIPMPVKKAAIRMQIGSQIERGAYTDDLGFAGTTVPAPAKPGLYELRISHLDVWGDEVGTSARAYVWDPNAPTVAIDVDCLPGMGPSFSKAAAAGLQRLAKGANIIYLSRRGAASHSTIHARMALADYPDGPVLEWQREYWHVVRDGKYYNMPRVVVENRLISQLPELHAMLGGLKVGVCDSAMAAKAFGDCGMKVVVIDNAKVQGANIVHRASWAELAEKGT